MAENSPLKKNRQRISPRKHPYMKSANTILTGQQAGQTTTVVRSPLRNIGKNVNAALPQAKIPFEKGKSNKVSSPIKPSLFSIVTGIENQTKKFSHFDGPLLFQDATIKINPTISTSNLKQDLSLRLPLTHSTAITNITATSNVGKIYTEQNESLPLQKELEHSDSLSQPQPVKKPAFGVIGEGRRSLSQGFIPVDKSCIIGGNEIHASDTPAYFDSSDLMNVSSSSLQCVTTGVLGQLQPKSLNTSFTDKFETRLGLNSDRPAAPQAQRKPLAGITIKRRSILNEGFIPILDAPEYSSDILKSWGDLERHHKVKYNYMEKHKEISHKMRTILIDWIAEVANEYNMVEETLHLAINYLDRFLSLMNVERTKLQLVGTTALLVAAKFEEMFPPETSDYVFITDEAYTKDQILKMEKTFLTALDFDLMVPTALDFALSYCSILQLGDPVTCMAMYLVELSLMDGDTYLKFLPSVIGGAAVVLGRYTFNNIYWDSKIKGLSTHRRKTITRCVKELQRSFFNASSQSHTTIYEKYQSVKHCQISVAFIPENGPWNEG